MQTLKGGQKYRNTMIAKFGSLEAWREYQRKNGSVGGRNGTGHKYGHGKVDPVENGRKGGAISRRRKKQHVEADAV